jgi:hypothetical protein
VEQVASMGQITELTLTGRSWTKGSMAVQSARPGHDYQVIMGPGSREGPGTRYAGRTQRRAFTAATIIYIVINIIVTFAMRYVEQRVAVPGLIGAKPAVSTH